MFNRMFALLYSLGSNPVSQAMSGSMPAKPKKQNNGPGFFNSLPSSPLATQHQVPGLVMPTVIAWDLDETIWGDCMPHYRRSMNETRKHFGLAELQDFKDTAYTSMEQMFTAVFGKKKSQSAQKYFFEMFASQPDIKLLKPNILETLQKLHTLKIKMIVVSNLDERLAESLLKSFGIRHYFQVVMAKKLNQEVKPDTKALLTGLGKINEIPGKHIWMIGDSLYYDIKCAVTAGCTGILYGKNSADLIDVLPYKPDAVIYDHNEIFTLIAQAKKQENREVTKWHLTPSSSHFL